MAVAVHEVPRWWHEGAIAHVVVLHESPGGWTQTLCGILTTAAVTCEAERRACVCPDCRAFLPVVTLRRRAEGERDKE